MSVLYQKLIGTSNLIKTFLYSQFIIGIFRKNGLTAYERLTGEKLPVTKTTRSAYKQYYKRLRKGVKPIVLYKRKTVNLKAADAAISTARETGRIQKSVKLACEWCGDTSAPLHLMKRTFSDSWYFLCQGCLDAFYKE